VTDDYAPGDLIPGVDPGVLEAAKQQFRAQTAAQSKPPVNEIRETGGPAENAQLRAFVAMPFGPNDLQIIYEHFVKPVVRRCGFACRRGDEILGPNPIMKQVYDEIRKSDVVIAELTGQNPNVLHEIGIADAKAKRVLLMAQSLECIPFNVEHRRVLKYEYTADGCEKFKKNLAEHLEQLKEDLNGPRSRRKRSRSQASPGAAPHRPWPIPAATACGWLRDLAGAR
jgi:hypothetical protein